MPTIFYVPVPSRSRNPPPRRDDVSWAHLRPLAAAKSARARAWPLAMPPVAWNRRGPGIREDDHRPRKPPLCVRTEYRLVQAFQLHKSIFRPDYPSDGPRGAPFGEKSDGISTCANRGGGIGRNIDLCKSFSCTSRIFIRLSLGPAPATTRPRRRSRFRMAPTRLASRTPCVASRASCVCDYEAAWGAYRANPRALSDWASPESDKPSENIENGPLGGL